MHLLFILGGGDLKLRCHKGNITAEVLLSFMMICSILITLIPISVTILDKRNSNLEKWEKAKILSEIVQHYLLSGELPANNFIIYGREKFLLTISRNHSKAVICINKNGDKHEENICHTVHE